MPSDEPVASQVLRRVLTRAMADAAFRRTVLEHPNDVVRTEMVRAGAPAPDVQFDAVEETGETCVVRVPFSESERKAQPALEPLFRFVDSASEADLARFVEAPKKKLGDLLGVEFAEDTDVVVRIESRGRRVLVLPQDEFGPVSPASGSPIKDKKIKLCPKGVTVDLCPADVTVDPCPRDVTFVDLCPADCTFSLPQCPDCTQTPTATIDSDREAGRSPDALPPDSVKKLSDLLDE